MSEVKKFTGKKILAVVAHPDDETFGMGGTLAYYALHGAEIDLICTTRGEAGDVPVEYLDQYPSIADLRVAELHCAAQTLGIQGVYFLDFRDFGMTGSETNRNPQALMNASLDEVSGIIARYIRQLRPDVVITHDPMGNYFHPDHIVTHQAVVLGFFQAGDADKGTLQDLPAFRPDGLYFYTFLRRRMKWLLWLMPLIGMDPKRYGRNGDINLEQILTMQMPVHVEIDYGKAAVLREQASRCHASQGGGRREMTFFGHIRRWLSASKDAFMQAYPAIHNGAIRKDFFDIL